MNLHILKELFDVWIQMEPHPLQSQEPDGDRHWISSYPILKVNKNLKIFVLYLTFLSFCLKFDQQ